MKKLGVNIDHVATLRQARKEGIPDIVQAALAAQKGGADSITIHLRLDRRHIQDGDVYRIKNEVRLPMNLEMAASDEIADIAMDVVPEQVCIVPEKRQELTTEGGLDVVSSKDKLKQIIPRLKAVGMEVSLFIVPDINQITASKDVGSDAVELHTGSYANAIAEQKQKELEKLAIGAKKATEHALKVNAGHGLDYENVVPVKDIPEVCDLNIGYSIICRSVFVGLERAVREMKDLII